MSQNMIAGRQAAFLVFILILGSAQIYMPESIAGRDAWIATLLAVPLGLYILFIIIAVQNMFPGQNMLNISELVLGKYLGKLLNISYVLLLFIVTVFSLYDLANFLDIILIDLKLYTYYFILILAAAYCIYKGVNAAARIAELLVWVIILLLFVAIPIAVMCCSDFSNLVPVLAEWKPVTAGALYAANWPFAQVSILIMYLPFVADLAKKQKNLYIWYLLGAVFLVMRSVLNISIMGVELSYISRFPAYESFRLLKIGTFERIDMTFFGLFFITSFLTLIIFYQALTMGVQKLLRLDNVRYLILPVGLVLITLSTYMFVSDMEMYIREIRVLPFITLPMHLLYPSIIFIASKIYKRKNISSKAAAP